VKILCIKGPDALLAADDTAMAALSKIRPGSLVAVNMVKPRNPAMHRWWWKLMDIIAENLDGEVSPETVCELVKLGIGHVDVIRINGMIREIPKSISFAAMDQPAFEHFRDRAVRYLVTEVIPGLDSEALCAEVDDLLGVRSVA
jgi:hypothetical protein